MRRLIVTVLILGALGAGAFWILTMPASVSALPSYTPDLANGQTMFNAGGCASCHATPEQDDRTRLGGGRELKSPFGSFYAPNISPHPDDGIGRLTEAQFVTAMWKGTSPDGRHYFPAFPYPSYQRMALADVRDLYAYMKTLPAVARQGARSRIALPVQHPTPGRRLEASLSRRPGVRG